MNGSLSNTETQRPHILIIYTGGTIGMIENAESGALEPFNFDHLIDNVPKIKRLDYDIDNFQFEVPLDSSAMTPDHWVQIVKVIEDNYDAYDGFVVLHGTDTMAYTASALSFMLENLRKPVVITGSQLPIGEVRTDGEENLITALQVAAEKDTDGSPMVQEVAILFEDYLWRGNRATKHSSDNFNAFKSSHYPRLAKVGLGIRYRKSVMWRSEGNEPLRTHYTFDNHVMYLDLFPGISEAVVRHQLAAPGLKGVVMKTFGSGNGPTSGWFLEALKEAVDRGLVIVNVSQCDNGIVNPTRYLSGNVLTKAGVISGHDLTSEAAITKLMFLFGQGLTPEQVKTEMEKPIAGEMD